MRALQSYQSVFPLGASKALVRILALTSEFNGWFIEGYKCRRYTCHFMAIHVIVVEIFQRTDILDWHSYTYVRTYRDGEQSLWDELKTEYWGLGDFFLFRYNTIMKPFLHIFKSRLANGCKPDPHTADVWSIMNKNGSFVLFLGGIQLWCHCW